MEALTLAAITAAEKQTLMLGLMLVGCVGCVEA